MRLMSFQLTTDQIRNRTKTVTRRLGWAKLKPGTVLCAVVKGMGIPKGDTVERLAYLVVTNVRREKLNSIGEDDVIREGFFGINWLDFVRMFCRHMGCRQGDFVTRIEFRYIPGGAFLPADPWRLSTVNENGNLKPSIPVESLTTVSLWTRGAIMPLPENATVREVFRPGNVIAWSQR